MVALIRSTPTRPVTTSVAALSLTVIMEVATSRSDHSVGSLNTDRPVGPGVASAGASRIRCAGSRSPAATART